jgi:hypothetical protein
LFSQKFISIIKGLKVTEAMALGNFKLHKITRSRVLVLFLSPHTKETEERKTKLASYLLFTLWENVTLLTVNADRMTGCCHWA